MGEDLYQWTDKVNMGLVYKEKARSSGEDARSLGGTGPACPKLLLVGEGSTLELPKFQGLMKAGSLKTSRTAPTL